MKNITTTTENTTTAAENIARSLSNFFDTKAEQYTEAKSKLLAQIQERPLYGLQWAEALAVNIAESELYEQAKQIAEKIHDDNGGSVEDRSLYLIYGVQEMAKRCTSQLIGNQMRGGSSSAFANATEAATREAASRFIRDTEGLLKRAAERGALTHA